MKWVFVRLGECTTHEGHILLGTPIGGQCTVVRHHFPPPPARPLIIHLLGIRTWGNVSCELQHSAPRFDGDSQIQFRPAEWHEGWRFQWFHRTDGMPSFFNLGHCETEFVSVHFSILVLQLVVAVVDAVVDAEEAEWRVRKTTVLPRENFLHVIWDETYDWNLKMSTYNYLGFEFCWERASNCKWNQ